MRKQINPLLLTIGDKIRILRKTTNLSQEDFATKAGMDRSYYGGIERGERNVSALNLVRIANALGCEVGDLFPSKEELKNLNWM